MSVVVPVRDDDAGLAVTLRALATQVRPADEVIVVDSASRVPLVLDPIAGPARVTVLRAEQPGSYRARNLGSAHATGDVVAFTDADCRPEPDWLANAVAQIGGRTGPVALGGRVRVEASGAGRRTWAECHDLLRAFPQREYVERRGFAVTANLVVTRAALDLVGGFDADLHSGGDVEWGHRATVAGVAPEYAHDVVVVHPARRTVRELLAKRRRIVAGNQQVGVARGGRDWTCWELLLPPIRTHWGHLRRDQGPVGMRVRAAVVAQLLRWATLVELLRLRHREARPGRGPDVGE